MSITIPSAQNTSVENSKKRKSAHEDNTSRKRSRREHRRSGSSKIKAHDADHATSDVIVTLRSSRISAIISKKKTSIPLKYTLPASVRRLWLCSRSSEPVLEHVVNIKSTDRKAEAESRPNVNKPSGKGKKSKYYYIISDVFQLEPPLNSHQLQRDGKIGNLSAKIQYLAPDQVVYLHSQPKNYLYGNELELIRDDDITETLAKQTEVAAKPNDRLQLSNFKGEQSPFQTQKASLYVPLPAVAQLYPLAGVCAEHMSPLILSYYKPLQGLILAYSNPRVSTDLPSSTDIIQQSNSKGSRESGEVKLDPLTARVHDELAISFMWLTVDLVLLRPTRKSFITGWINLVTESHIGLICWNLFSASVPVKCLPRDWKWMSSRAKNAYSSTETRSHEGAWQTKNDTDAAEGYFQDSDGKIVEGWLTFRVEDFDIISTEKFGGKGFLSIQGSLLREGEMHQISDEIEDDHVAQEKRFIDLEGHDTDEFDRPNLQ